MRWKLLFAFLFLAAGLALAGCSEYLAEAVHRQ
jgi:hypothetical protein